MNVGLIAPLESLGSGRVWGTGGWMEPGAREALDWLTMVRFLGWDPRVITLQRTGDLVETLPSSVQIVIIASDPERLSDSAVAGIEDLLQRQSVLVVCRAPLKTSPIAPVCDVWRTGVPMRGRSIRWTGLGSPLSWRTAREVAGEQICIG